MYGGGAELVVPRAGGGGEGGGGGGGVPRQGEDPEPVREAGAGHPGVQAVLQEAEQEPLPGGGVLARAGELATPSINQSGEGPS